MTDGKKDILGLVELDMSMVVFLDDDYEAVSLYDQNAIILNCSQDEESHLSLLEKAYQDLVRLSQCRDVRPCRVKALEIQVDTPDKKDDYTQMVVADEHPS